MGDCLGFMHGLARLQGSYVISGIEHSGYRPLTDGMLVAKPIRSRVFVMPPGQHPSA